MTRTFCAMLLVLPWTTASVDAAALNRLDGPRPAERSEDRAPTLRSSVFNFDPGWGNLEVGQTEGAARRLLSGATPKAGAFSGKALKGSFYTPVVDGFQVGVSYTPLGVNAGIARTRHMVEGAVARRMTTGSTRLRLTAGAGSAAGRKRDGVARRTWMAGGEASRGAVRIAVVVRDQDVGAASTTTVGGTVAMETGPLRLSGDVVRSWSTDGTAYEAWSTEMSYELLPRVTMTADIGNARTAGTEDGTVIMVGSKIGF